MATNTYQDIQTALRTVLPEDLYAKYATDIGQTKAVCVTPLPPRIEMADTGVEIVIKRAPKRNNTYHLSRTEETTQHVFWFNVFLWQNWHTGLQGKTVKVLSLDSPTADGESVLDKIYALGSSNGWDIHARAEPRDDDNRTPEGYELSIAARPQYCD